MRKSTMVTFTSGDRHRFEPPRTQTAFIDLTNLSAKKLLQPTWLENYKALGFQTNSSRSGKKCRVCCFCPEYPVIPGCRWVIEKKAFGAGRFRPYTHATMHLEEMQMHLDLDARTLTAHAHAHPRAQV